MIIHIYIYSFYIPFFGWRTIKFWSQNISIIKYSIINYSHQVLYHILSLFTLLLKIGTLLPTSPYFLPPGLWQPLFMSLTFFLIFGISQLSDTMWHLSLCMAYFLWHSTFQIYQYCSGWTNNQISTWQINRKKTEINKMYTFCTHGEHPGMLSNSPMWWKPSP